ncbi:MAG: hypothetical protein DPW09_45620 [Anaerolineae bacterium]|nr:hypothetical protein [Anaerolineae bacterium]
MLGKVELRVGVLVYLYNLLVPEMAKFVCRKEGCDPRPYSISPVDLDQAEGVIACDVCGELCYRVLEDHLQRPLL